MNLKYAPFVAAAFFLSSFFSENVGGEIAFGLGQDFAIDFDVAMRPSKEYKPQFSLAKDDWKKIRSFYDKHIINDLKYSEQPRIPKIIHQIWFGSPFPEKYKALQETWKKHHPTWEYKLWTEKEIEEFGLTNKHLYDEAQNYGAKADIARYEILYRIGGLYVDTDFECLKPFDIFNHCCNFYAGVAFHKDVFLFNGLIGAVPGHPVLKTCILSMKHMANPLENGSEILERTGPFFFTRCFFESIDKQSGPSVVFPLSYFYPWPNYERYNNAREQILMWVCPESYGVHHWHSSWIRR